MSAQMKVNEVHSSITVELIPSFIHILVNHNNSQICSFTLNGTIIQIEHDLKLAAFGILLQPKLSVFFPSFCSQRPSLVEYLSYNLNFLSVLVGPCSNYQDYVDFIDGRHIQRRLRKQAEGEGNGHLNGYDKTPDISPLVGGHRS